MIARGTRSDGARRWPPYERERRRLRARRSPSVRRDGGARHHPSPTARPLAGLGAAGAAGIAAADPAAAADGDNLILGQANLDRTDVAQQAADAGEGAPPEASQRTCSSARPRVRTALRRRVEQRTGSRPRGSMAMTSSWAIARAGSGLAVPTARRSERSATRSSGGTCLHERGAGPAHRGASSDDGVTARRPHQPAIGPDHQLRSTPVRIFCVDAEPGDLAVRGRGRAPTGLGCCGRTHDRAGRGDHTDPGLDTRATGGQPPGGTPSPATQRPLKAAQAVTLDLAGITPIPPPPPASSATPPSSHQPDPATYASCPPAPPSSPPPQLHNRQHRRQRLHQRPQPHRRHSHLPHQHHHHLPPHPRHHRLHHLSRPRTARRRSLACRA